MPRLQEIAGSAEWVRSGAKLTEWSYSWVAPLRSDGHYLGVEALFRTGPPTPRQRRALVTCVISGPCRRLWRMWHGATQRLIRDPADSFAGSPAKDAAPSGVGIGAPEQGDAADEG